MVIQLNKRLIYEVLMNKLHLGCGKIHIPGYINVDIQDYPSVDVRADVFNLPFEKESFDLIYSCAVIEHFGRNEWKNLLKYWSTFLKPGGKLRLSTSDFDACCKRYMETKALPELLGILIGGQKDDWDWHGMIFNFEILKSALEEIGFINVQRYDWRTTDYGQLGVDDFSQAYLPHMDKENGMLMVLNVEADKPFER
jgi:predicted SAM-dependent methyltransferase